jgi:hypothetical protein
MLYLLVFCFATVSSVSYDQLWRERGEDLRWIESLEIILTLDVHPLPPPAGHWLPMRFGRVCDWRMPLPIISES